MISGHCDFPWHRHKEEEGGEGIYRGYRMMRPPLLPIQLVTPGHSCLQSTDASCGPDCLVNLSFITVSTQRPQAPLTKANPQRRTHRPS